MGIAALIISIISLVFTGSIFFFYDKKLKEQGKELNQYILEEKRAEKKRKDAEEEDKKKAWITKGGFISFNEQGGLAKSILPGRTGSMKFCNSGKVRADNIRVTFLKDNEIIKHNRQEPYGSLMPGKSEYATFGFPESLLDDIPINVKFTWDDEFGKDRENIETMQL